MTDSLEDKLYHKNKIKEIAYSDENDRNYSSRTHHHYNNSTYEKNYSNGTRRTCC